MITAPDMTKLRLKKIDSGAQSEEPVHQSRKERRDHDKGVYGGVILIITGQEVETV